MAFMRKQCSEAAPNDIKDRSGTGRSGLLAASLCTAGALLGAWAIGAAAQAPSLKVAPGDELRAIYATAQDVSEGRRIAERSCARCHGIEGIAVSKGVPHLAGQRPAYILLELRAYKAGARDEKTMEEVVKILNEDTLVQVAAYYASLPPAPPARTSSAKPAPFKDPIAAGKAAAAGCAGCHGEGGISRNAGTPSLVGLDPKYLLAAMGSYKGGQRKHDLMKSLLSAVGEADMKNIALYFATQKAARAQTPATGDKTAGKDASTACAGCHGEKGVSSNPATPSLAGQDAQYIAIALQAYKDGSRNDASMKGLASALEDRAMKNLGAFYAGQQPQAPAVIKPLSPAQLAQRCDRCHGLNGNSTDPRLPALAAQRVDYLEKVLHAYRTGARKSPQMAAMAGVLSEDDVEGLANLYARQTPRSAIYVIVPSK
jgi:cytochrome c553